MLLVNVLNNLLYVTRKNLGEDSSEREREHLSTSREACMLKVYRRRRKKIKHVNKTWPYLVHPMMLLGGRRKKKT